MPISALVKKIGAFAKHSTERLPVALLWLVPLLTPGCAVATRRFIDYDAKQNRVVKKPDFIDVGDSLILRISGARWAYRYVPTVSTDSGVEVTSPPIAGAADVKALATAFLPSELLPISAKAAPKNSSTALSTRIPRDALKNLNFSIANYDSAKQQDRAGKPERAREFEARSDSLKQEIEVAYLASIQALVAHLQRAPDQLSVVSFMVDHAAWRAAEALARSAVPEEAAKRIKETTKAAINADTTVDVDTSNVVKLRQRFESYLEELDLLTARYSGDPRQALLDSTTEALLDTVRAIRAGRCALNDVANANSRAETCMAADPADTLTIGGVGLGPLLALPYNSHVTNFIDNLLQISVDAPRVAAAANVLAIWASPVDALCHFQDSNDAPCYFEPVGSFKSGGRLTISLQQQNRFGYYLASPLSAPSVAEASASADAAASGQGTGTATQSGNVGKQQKGKSDKKADASTSKSGKDLLSGSGTDSDTSSSVTAPFYRSGSPVQLVSPSPPTIQLDVVQRYHYRFTLGVARFWTATRTYDVTNDTLRVTSTAGPRLVPIATISYVLFPTRGEMRDEHEDDWNRNPIAHSAFSLQGGLGLTDPTKNVVLGVGWDPVPAMTFSAGIALSYVTRGQVTANQPVAANSTGTVQQWRTDFMSSLTIDASIILGTVGSLLGIK